MNKGTVKTGLDIIGDVPWGTHFCHFYRTKHELIDVLVPYFKAGLESNEFCMWVTSEPLVEQDARKAMSEAMPGFDRYLKTGQIEIMPHDQWYLQDGVFDSDLVLRGWVGKLDSALARGYAGLRVTGNIAWLEKKDWASFADYEAAVTSVTGKYKMVVLCSYSLEKCGAAEVIEAARSHTFAIVSHNGNPELVEGTLYRQTREALAQLRVSEERNRLLVENAAEGIVVLQDGKVAFHNAKYVDIAGFPEEELVSMPFIELIHPDDRQMMTERYGTRLKGEKISPTYAVRAIDKAGNVKWVEANTVSFTWNGRPAILAMVTDITKRKRAEEELQRKEQHFRALIENSSDGIAIADRDGTILYNSPSIDRMLGYTFQEQIGRHMLAFIHPDDIQVVSDTFPRLLQNPSATMQIEVRLQHKDSTWRTMEIIATNLLDNPAVEGIVVNLRDITKSKQGEGALKASEAKFKGLFEHMTSGGAIYEAVDNGEDFVFKDFNPAGEKIDKVSKEDVLGRRVTEAFPGVKELAQLPQFDLGKSFAGSFSRSPMTWRGPAPHMSAHQKAM